MGDKLLMYDWRCEECGIRFDALEYSTVYVRACPECGEESKRLISAPRLDPRMGLDPYGFPTMGDKWARTRIQRRKIEDAKAARHGED